jgi:hypothetical protein
MLEINEVIMIQVKMIEKNNVKNKFIEFFGKKKFKGMPLYLYAEMLFYAGMQQMIKDYTLNIFEAETLFSFAEIDGMRLESKVFFPLSNKDEDVELTNHFGTSETLSCKTASMIVWLYVIEQIAIYIREDDDNTIVYNRICDAMDSIKYKYPELVDEKKEPLFPKRDHRAIYNLID